MAWVRTKENKLYKDAEGNKVDTKDWKNIPLSMWNTTTFMEMSDTLTNRSMEEFPSTLPYRLYEQS